MRNNPDVWSILGFQFKTDFANSLLQNILMISPGLVDSSPIFNKELEFVREWIVLTKSFIAFSWPHPRLIIWPMASGTVPPAINPSIKFST